MNFQIAMLLGQDGVTNGAIYALLALSILLVFTVTRILLIPLGEFVTFGALTMAALQAGQPTRLVWLLLALTVIDCTLDLLGTLHKGHGFRLPKYLPIKLAYAVAMVLLVQNLLLANLPMAIPGPADPGPTGANGPTDVSLVLPANRPAPTRWCC